MTIYPISRQVCAIITTYEPGPRLIKCVKKILPQVAEIIIVDDGDSEENVRKLRMWFGDEPNVILWHQPFNSGIAAALNIGVNIAKKRGYEWILTLDDDSIPDRDMMERLCDCYTRFFSLRPLGIIGMLMSESACQKTLHIRSESPVCLDKRGIITSGSLFSVKIYNEIGPFREEFFIDSVDYDFCMRARAKGYKVIQVQEYGFIHSLGQNEIFKFGKYIINTVSHSPDRLYYSFRNSTILAKEYLVRDPLFAFATALFQLKVIFKIILFQLNKKRKLTSAVRGYWDAVKKNMGTIRN